MKLHFNLLISLLLTAACASDRIPTEVNAPSSRENYAYGLSEEIFLSPPESERFELRHGDCGSDAYWSDCDNDRQRIERVSSWSRAQSLTYRFAIYLPKDFKSLHPSNTSLAQVKSKSWRHPIWMVQLNREHLEWHFNDVGRSCPLLPLSDMRGKWTRFVIHAGYGGSETGPVRQDGQYGAIWVNGARIPCHALKSPLTGPGLRQALGIKGSSFRYGIYNSYVSRYLGFHATKPVEVKGWADVHVKEGNTNHSQTNRPFALDWGIKLPTQIVFFDDIAISTDAPEEEEPTSN